MTEFVQYVVTGNSDTTEGKGYSVVNGVFTELKPAYELTVSGKHGVWGCKGDNTITKRVWRIEGNEWVKEDTNLWGYVGLHDFRGVKVVGDYGWLKKEYAADFDGDPEYTRYLELKKKFEG